MNNRTGLAFAKPVRLFPCCWFFSQSTLIQVSLHYPSPHHHHWCCGPPVIAFHYQLVGSAGKVANGYLQIVRPGGNHLWGGARLDRPIVRHKLEANGGPFGGHDLCLHLVAGWLRGNFHQTRLGHKSQPCIPAIPQHCETPSDGVGHHIPNIPAEPVEPYRCCFPVAKHCGAE